MAPAGVCASHTHTRTTPLRARAYHSPSRALFILTAAVVLHTTQCADAGETTADGVGFQSLSGFLSRTFSRVPCVEYAAWGEHGVSILGHRLTSFDESATSLSWEDMRAAIRSYMNVWRGWMLQEARWPLDSYANIGSDVEAIADGKPVLLPYVAKVTLPQGARVAVFGDLHGAAHSFLRTLSSLRTSGYLDDDLRVSAAHRHDFFMLFLGDFVDRGFNGAEVLYIILTLRTRNPGNVFVSRGNHEDALMNEGHGGGSFQHELRVKFPRATREQLAELYQVYETLPVAQLVGRAEERCIDGNYFLAVHGGIEVGYDVRPLLASPCAPTDAASAGATVQFARIPALLRHQWLMHHEQQALRGRIQHHLHRLFMDFDGKGDRRYPAPPTGVHPPLGYMWWDFMVHDNASTLDYSDGRGFIFGLPATDHWLDRTGVVAVVRAHQHNNARASGPMLHQLVRFGGIVDNWNQSGRVLTLLSGGFIPGLNFRRDSYGWLTLNGVSTRAWRLEHCSQMIGRPLLQVQSKQQEMQDAEFGAPRSRPEWVCNESCSFTCVPVDWRPRDHTQDSNGTAAFVTVTPDGAATAAA